MCLQLNLRQARWGAGTCPVAVDREVVYFDMMDGLFLGDEKSGLTMVMLWLGKMRESEHG